MLFQLNVISDFFTANRTDTHLFTNIFKSVGIKGMQWNLELELRSRLLLPFYIGKIKLMKYTTTFLQKK